MLTKLRTEADVIRALEAGCYPIDEIYDQIVAAGVSERDNGHDLIHSATDLRFKRRARSVLQHMKRTGEADGIGDTMWLINGATIRPTRALLVICRNPSEIELVLGDVEEILRGADEPIDLIFADPCWGLHRQDTDWRGTRQERLYGRNSDQVVPGYVDVDPAEYEDFTHRWIEAAAGALRPRGGYLCAVTGPQQSGIVQVAARHAGLTYVNQLAIRKKNPMRSTRRFAHAHMTANILCTGPLDNDKRYFATPADLPKARSGADYPLDVWDDIPPQQRPGLLRYDNALPAMAVRRILHALTPGEWQALVSDPFLGSGTTAMVCLEEKRRFIGGDVNPHSLRFCMARTLVERPNTLPL